MECGVRGRVGIKKVKVKKGNDNLEVWIFTPSFPFSTSTFLHLPLFPLSPHSKEFNYRRIHDSCLPL